MNHDYSVVLTTFSKLETGDRIASGLLEGKLAACVQTFPIVSRYTWKGSLCKDDETMMLIKTRTSLVAQAVAKVRELHDYETPEVIALPIADGSDAYFKWIDEVTM